MPQRAKYRPTVASERRMPEPLLDVQRNCCAGPQEIGQLQLLWVMVDDNLGGLCRLPGGKLPIAFRASALTLLKGALPAGLVGGDPFADKSDG